MERGEGTRQPTYTVSVPVQISLPLLQNTGDGGDVQLLQKILYKQGSIL